MNYKAILRIMKNYFKTIVSSMVMFAMVFSAFAAPFATANAITGFDSDFGFDSDLELGTALDLGLLTENSDSEDDSSQDSSSETPQVVTSSAGSSSHTECSLTASSYDILVGENVTLNWNTIGFTDVKLNGESLSGGSGSKTFSNLQVSTNFVLEATNTDGSSCFQRVVVNCEPPELPVRCEDYGYDFQIAKFEWNGSSYVKEAQKSGYSVTVDGDASVAHWIADPAVAGVLAKAATNITEFSGGLSGSVNKADIGTGKHAISNIAFCGKNTPPEPKFCELKVTKEVDKTSASVGDSLTYTIKVENIGDADCTGGGVKIEDVVDANIRYVSHNITSNLNAGYETLPVYTSGDRTLHFNGNVLNPGEKGTITWVGEIQTPSQCGDFEVKNQAKATAAELDNFKDWAYSQIVKTQVDNDCAPKPCELTVNKTVDKDNAKVGDKLVYTITVENTGSANCTGSGVKIEDVLDQYVKYVKHTLTSNLGAGYLDKPVYTSADRTLHFNGFVLEPGEFGKITVIGKVLGPAQCGDFEVKNQAKATAAELDNFMSWAYSPIVTTQIDNDCTVPKIPECTLTPALQTIEYGAKATLTWTTNNAHTVSITDFGGVPLNGSDFTANLFADKSYTLTAIGNDGQVSCHADVKVGEPRDEFAEVVAEKIICTDESELPNYGLGGPNITVDTASDWVASHASCSLASDWEFEWTDDQSNSNDPADDFVGTVGLPWKTFGPTDDLGKTSVTINLNDLANDRVWFREVLKTDYIPFTHGLNGETNVDDVSAEFYCDIDVINYDNREYVTNMEDNGTYHCVAWNSPVPEAPAPSCDLFIATPDAIMVGASSTLSWESTNAVQAFLNNEIGAVDVDGSISISPLVDTTYRLTLIGAEDKTVDCEVPVTVSEDPVPVCEFFTATPNALPVGGGDVTLDWEVVDATTVTIEPTVGTVGLTGTQDVNVTQSTTYKLTAVDADGDEVSCVAPVAVADPEPPFTCGDNVSFTASDTSIRVGTDIDLNWSTTDVDSVLISKINATTLSGSQTVSPTGDITYVLTATQGDKSIDCPVSIDVSTGGGGGGGGSSSPRCDLDISDTKIKVGEEITLTWDTSRATEITLKNDLGKILFTTDDFLSSEKDDYFDGSIKVKPTRDTKYTLVAERGSRDRECSVEVEMDDLVVLQTRDQQPLVAGISLSQVPYTGFEAGPVMTILFYMLLAAWALYITYMLVVRKRLVTNIEDEPIMDMPVLSRSSQFAPDVTEDNKSEMVTASAVVESATTSVTPTNLPTGASTVGYENVVTNEVSSNAHQVTDGIVTDLENRAHAQKALLSSDAVRYFISATEGSVERNEYLDEVITEAKKTYPLEDGWAVINESRMQNLCVNCEVEEDNSFSPTIVPEGAGSLAEAIVTGNVVAAYEMIGNRPMFALADAASDMDSVYRHRKGEEVKVSNLLISETEKLSDEQIKNMIAALTGALDGTYTDEASAVKMAIMKAVKEVA